MDKSSSLLPWLHPTKGGREGEGEGGREGEGEGGREEEGEGERGGRGGRERGSEGMYYFSPFITQFLQPAPTSFL